MSEVFRVQKLRIPFPARTMSGSAANDGRKTVRGLPLPEVTPPPPPPPGSNPPVASDKTGSFEQRALRAVNMDGLDSTRKGNANPEPQQPAARAWPQKWQELSDAPGAVRVKDPSEATLTRIKKSVIEKQLNLSQLLDPDFDQF